MPNNKASKAFREHTYVPIKKNLKDTLPISKQYCYNIMYASTQKFNVKYCH